MSIIPKSIIKQWLEENKVTQKEFAKRIGCTPPFLNGLLSRKNVDIKIRLLRQIMLTTGFSAEDIINDLLVEDNSVDFDNIPVLRRKKKLPLSTPKGGSNDKESSNVCINR